MGTVGLNASVDFRTALHRLLAVPGLKPEQLHRAFAVWVLLFDLADDELRVAVPARQLSRYLGGVSRVVWTKYRRSLVDAGLVVIEEPSRPNLPQILHLIPPRH